MSTGMTYLPTGTTNLPADILTLIFAHTCTGAMYKAIVSTCGWWRKIVLATPDLYAMRNIYCNHLETLITRCAEIGIPHSAWDWDAIIYNHSVTWEFILPNVRYINHATACFFNLSWDYAVGYAIAHPAMITPDQWGELSRHSGLDWKIIREHIH